MRSVMKYLKKNGKYCERGQAMVEFALVLPFLVALLCFIVDFAWIFSCKNDLTNLAGQTARYAAIQTNKGKTDDAVISSVQAYVHDHGYNSQGAATPSEVQVDKANGYVRVKLQEEVPYLTGITGALTGHGNDEMLTAEAAAPIETAGS